MITFAANPMEWAFLLSSVLLVCFTFYALREAIIDGAYLVANGMNGPRTTISDQNIREESIKLAIGMMMLGAALSSVFLAPPPPDYHELPQSMVSMLAWIVVAMLMVISSGLSLSVRSKLQQFSPVEVQKTVGTIEPSSRVQMAADAEAMRDNSKVRHGDRGGEGDP